jgi:hypothetical protein
MKVTAIVVLALLLAACASTGLYNMSDDWCTRHSNASAARCPNNQEALRASGQNTGEQNAGGPNASDRNAGGQNAGGQNTADQNKERVAHNQAQPND